MQIWVLMLFVGALVLGTAGICLTGTMLLSRQMLPAAATGSTLKAGAAVHGNVLDAAADATCGTATRDERVFVHGPTMVKLLPNFLSENEADHMRKLGDELLKSTAKGDGQNMRKVAMFRSKKWGQVWGELCALPADVAVRLDTISIQLCQTARRTRFSLELWTELPS
eukprot:SAG31_NODE_763_length_12265_cov_3.024984_13_plen_168_part_00